MKKALLSLTMLVFSSACMNGLLNPETADIIVLSNQTKSEVVSTRTETRDETMTSEEMQANIAIIESGYCFNGICQVRVTRTTSVTHRYYEVRVRNSGGGSALNIQARVKVRTAAGGLNSSGTVAESEKTFPVISFLDAGQEAAGSINLQDDEVVVEFLDVTWSDAPQSSDDEDCDCCDDCYDCHCNQ